MKKLLSLMLACLMLVSAVPLAAALGDSKTPDVLAANTVPVKSGPILDIAEPNLGDNVFNAAEYGNPIASVAPANGDWTDYTLRRNASVANCTAKTYNDMAPDSMKLYFRCTKSGLYIAVAVDTDAYFADMNAAANAGTNWFTHIRTFFKTTLGNTQSTGHQAALQIPKGGTEYTQEINDVYGGLVEPGVSGGKPAKVDYTRDNAAGVSTYELFYKWENIIPNFATAGLPKKGDTLYCQVNLCPARDKNDVYAYYINMAGTTAAERVDNAAPVQANNLGPQEKWFAITLDEDVPDGSVALPTPDGTAAVMISGAGARAQFILPKEPLALNELTHPITFDGVLDEEEWGTAADLTYTPDNDALPESMEWFWRYDTGPYLFCRPRKDG